MSVVTARQNARRTFVTRRFRQKPAYRRPYLQWLEDSFDYNVDNFGDADYVSVSSGLRAALLHSSFWQRLCDGMDELDRDFRYSRGAYLFRTLDPPIVGTKTFESFLKKTYRFNVVENRDWPDEPVLGWVMPSNWYQKVNDIVRGQLITRHIDGAIFLAQQLQKIAEETKAPSDLTYRAYDDGYYAIHFYALIDARVLRKSIGRYEGITGQVELQITTTMQEVIKQMLHEDYRKKRTQMTRQRTPWQWRYEDRDFVLNFLGHELQSLDGTICRLRAGKGTNH